MDWRKRNISAKEKRSLVTKLVDIMQELSDSDVVHRDIKPANFLLHFPGESHLNQSEVGLPDFVKQLDLCDYEYDLKLCDFGLARKNSELLTDNRGTPAYKSP